MNVQCKTRVCLLRHPITQTIFNPRAKNPATRSCFLPAARQQSSGCVPKVPRVREGALCIAAAAIGDEQRRH